MIGISACLGGVLCRYDGKHQAVPPLIELVRSSWRLADPTGTGRNRWWRWGGRLGATSEGRHHLRGRRDRTVYYRRENCLSKITRARHHSTDPKREKSLLWQSDDL